VRTEAYLAQVLCTVLVLTTVCSDVDALERRRDQFTKEPAYYIIPMPYSLPGIGKGVVVGGAYNNIADTHSDVIGFIIGGDLTGVGVLSLDNHIIPKRLILDVYAQHLSKAAIRNYNSHGMSSSADDYSILNLKDNDYYAARLTGTWWERKLELYGAALYGRSHLDAIHDKDGNLIQSTSNATANSSTLYTLGLRVDWTDDYVDPRRGIRYQLSRWWANNNNSQSADYYQIEHNLTAYVPVGKRSTWVFNYFQADAHVTRMGETDFATVEAQQGLNCSDPALTSEQQLQCQQVVNNIIATNTYGSVGSLGGWSRLRAYPDGRYQGAHALFLGTEFRWNLTEEFTPFDIWIARDIRTTIQLAAFYERGTIEDTKAKLGDIWRDSYGIGARIVTASGLVIRGDIARGHEGTEVSLIIGYPWESF